MNKELEQFIRQKIKLSMELYTSEQLRLFRQMHSAGDTAKSFNEIIDEIPSDKLVSVMDQAKWTIAKNQIDIDAGAEAPNVVQSPKL